MAIVDLKVGDRATAFYLVKNAQIKTSKTSKPYLDADLIDSSGEINAKVWDSDESILNVFAVGEIVHVDGNVGEWAGKKQLKVNNFRPANSNDDVDMSHFIPTAPIKPQEMYDFIADTINGFKDSQLRNLTMAIILDKKPELMVWPAAKSNHHAIRFGLLYHIYRMLKSAKALGSVYTSVNVDLLQSGIILHDICKTDEMLLNSFGLVSEYSIQGNLLGHITMGVNIIDEYGKKLSINPELVLLLKHMILSHHGIPDIYVPHYLWEST